MTSGISAIDRIVSARLLKKLPSAGPPTSNSSALASKVLRLPASPVVIGQASSENSRPDPAIMNQLLTS